MPKKVVTKKNSDTNSMQAKNMNKTNQPESEMYSPIKKTPLAKSLSVEDDFHSKSDSSDMLVENFVALQKVMTNLAVKFDDLSSQISRLLELFEISAKSIAGKDFDTNRLEKKVDKVLEQNKVIARGVSLIHEPEENRTEGLNSEHPRFKEWPKS